MIHVDLGTKGACSQQYSVEICIFAALFLKFGRADDTVLVPATIDTSLYRDPSGLAVLKSLEGKTPPLDSNRQVSPIDSHSSPDMSSGQSPHVYTSSTSMGKFNKSSHPRDPRSAPDRTPTRSAEAPPIVPMDNERKMDTQQYRLQLVIFVSITGDPHN
ncbi:hypothetical protein BHYA_0116g00300 [Botrytis hyacinthi]|uniref:Uncharacterized protein n=1 Tax=Botrytis hyacinthi TaxID=278943 RepID=A0A4Z1GMV4_9HELO|nr:hypothetical protein BHYA_0116g00300 [Botrytis hyacinthi]